MEKELEFKRKRTRVKYFNYTGCSAYFVTICAFDKQPRFKDSALIKELINLLKQEAEKHDFKIYAYCFMPDHLHLLLIGDDKSSLVNFIKIFKQKSGYTYKQRFKENLWQRSFYDHVVRKKEDINEIAAYIFMNPMRKKMADDFRAYPFLGSLVFDVNKFYDLFGQRKNIDINYL